MGVGGGGDGGGEEEDCKDVSRSRRWWKRGEGGKMGAGALLH